VTMTRTQYALPWGAGRRSPHDAALMKSVTLGEPSSGRRPAVAGEAGLRRGALARLHGSEPCARERHGRLLRPKEETGSSSRPAPIPDQPRTPATGQVWEHDVGNALEKRTAPLHK
jgi:hypothetical protein